jgi:hypothetical protein
MSTRLKAELTFEPPTDKDLAHGLIGRERREIGRWR